MKRIVCLLLCACFPSLAGAQVRAITNVRVFDGAQILERATVVFEGSTIRSVGTEAPPRRADVIDGAGGTLIPGLIDGHVHTFGPALEHALNFGVTTVLDMFTLPAFAQNMKAQQERGEATGRADLFSAGYLVTAPGGHGTQFGMPVPTITEAQSAKEFINDRVEDGADFIKIVLEDGATVGRPIPTLSDDTFRAVVAAAQANNRLAVVHTSTLEKAMLAAETRANGLVHLYYDQGPSDEFVALAKQNGLFVVPTMAVIQSASGMKAGRALLERPEAENRLHQMQSSSLRQGFPARPGPTPEERMAWVLATVGKLEEAGVPVLAGTDAPNPGTAFGVSMHQELELLVRAGLSEVSALAAATSRPADAFGLKDRGRIAPGKKADFFLVGGNPTEDIQATLDIQSIWKDGELYERKTYEPVERPPVQPALVGAFDTENWQPPYGSWSASNDGLQGGDSTSAREWIEPGAGRSAGALRVSGTLSTSNPFPFAGAMFTPGDNFFEGRNASAAKQIVFYARSADGRTTTLDLRVFAEQFGRLAPSFKFGVGPGWRLYAIPFTQFDSDFDGSDLTGVFFGAVEEGAYSFDIDQVELR